MLTHAQCQSKREKGSVMKHYTNYEQQSTNDVGMGGIYNSPKDTILDTPHRQGRLATTRQFVLRTDLGQTWILRNAWQM